MTGYTPNVHKDDSVGSLAVVVPVYTRTNFFETHKRPTIPHSKQWHEL